MKNPARLLALALFLAGSLAACSKHGDQPASPAQSKAPVLGVQQAAPAELEQPNPLVSASSYIPITSGNQLMFLYYALSKMPPDFESMAMSFSQDYRNTNDAFKKNDIMSALKPQMLAAIEAAKSQRYGIWTLDYVPVGHYDFNKKSFFLNSPFLTGNGTGYYRDNSSYQVNLKNGDAFNAMPVADENVAKQIEALVSRGQGFTVKIYFFAQSADLSQHYVNAVATRVDLIDRGGNILASNPAKQ